MTAMKHKMPVEIWSDVMCPFCYIGKRKFEAALEQFQNKENIEIVWKSFQLSPELKTQPGKNIHSYLSEHKGIPVEEAKQLNDRVSQMAKQVGLVYNFDKSVVANSFNAHRFSHFAKQYGKQGEAEEKLFHSYFTDGKNIDDYEMLVQLGSEIGLDTEQLKDALDNNKYADEVRNDIYEAQQMNIRGVPFFLFNNKFAVSGAQDSRVFLETLEKSFSDWRKENPEEKLEVLEGQTCIPGEDCK